MKNKKPSIYIKNIIFPCLIFSLITGAFTSFIILAFKAASGYVMEWSEEVYALLRAHPVFLPAALLIIAAIAFLSRYFYRFFPDSQGGGIPTAIAILRGIVTFRWLRNLIGVFTASLVTFFLGIPLGNEGPCVQMGTAVGRGAVRIFGRKNRAWDRYVMTGGSCAGFAVATGAPISGIFFAIEEAHQRLSPMIIMVASSTVMFANLFTQGFAGLFGVSTSLIGEVETLPLALKEQWIPALIGILVGLFSVGFLFLNKLIVKLVSGPLKRLDIAGKMLIVLVLTLGFGMLSYSFLGTGHHQVESAIHGDTVVYLSVFILLFRAVLTLFANNSGATGGLFIPILALGALFSSLIGKALLAMGLSETYYSTIVLLGIAACLSGTIKSPITAIVFAMEALSLSNNITAIILSVTLSFMITELFGAHSINESVIKTRAARLNRGKETVTYDAFVKVSEKSFVIGKAIRDIFWPNNLFVLSIKHSHNRPEVNEHGDKSIRAGDILHVRFATCDYERTADELAALVGNNDWQAQKADSV